MGHALKVRVALVAWFGVALIAGASDAPSRLHPPVPQLMVLVLTLALIVAERRAPTVHEHVASVRTRVLVALHLTRFVGFGFLALAARGELPREFAVPAGWGDIGVATLAALLLVFGGDPRGPRRPLWIAWNALGLLDLVFVVVSAGRQALADPESIAGMVRLPMSLLPLFLVPILLATHVWIFRRLIGSDEAAA
jgi:hypothetical protein